MRNLSYDAVIIGGGVVGVELATILGALGAHVTIIEKKERLLAPMDGELSAALETLLRRRGIEVLTNATVERAAEGDGAPAGAGAVSTHGSARAGCSRTQTVSRGADR